MSRRRARLSCIVIYSTLKSQHIRWRVVFNTAITPQSGQTYTIGSLSLETGKWLLFGATLAGGDLIIDGNIISRLNGRNANTSSDISMRAFAISNGGIVNLKLVSNGFGMLHADKTYCGLTAVRIG